MTAQVSVTAVPASSPGLLTSGIARTTAGNELGKETFLQLLMAQLRYQDPTNPTDSTTFLAQSAQFTALEKMQEVADRTAELLAAQVAFGATSLIGRTVSYPTGSDGSQATGRVDGVRFEASGPVLVINGSQVAVGSVSSVTAGATTTVTAPAAAASSAAPAATGTSTAPASTTTTTAATTSTATTTAYPTTGGGTSGSTTTGGGTSATANPTPASSVTL